MDRIEVSYTAGDIAMMNLVVWRRWVMLWAIFAVVLILIPVLFALWDGFSALDAVAQVDWSLTGWILLFLISWTGLMTVLGYWVRRRKGMHGPIYFGLTDNGLSIRNRDMDSVIFWSAIKSVRTFGSRTFLFINSRSALIIPRRAFKTDAEFATFAADARKNWVNRKT